MTQVTDEHIDALCNQLQHNGSAVLPDGGGGHLAFIASDVLTFAQPLDGPSILVAWTGKGALFWNVANKIGTFDLIEAGFSLRVAPTLASILHRVADRIGERSWKGGAARPMLEVRKDMDEGD